MDDPWKARMGRPAWDDRDRERDRSASAARHAAIELAARGVVAVAVTFVDNSGITRVKGVPTGRLDHAAAWGVGASPVFDTFLVDDSSTSSRHAGGPVGDLRLHPDIDRLTPLAAQPGWAWAPADRLDQRGRTHPQDARGCLRRQTTLLAGLGLRALAAFEVEWTVSPAGSDEFVPACSGPAYGMTRLVELSDYLRELIGALTSQGLTVEQIHPEYAAGQFEVSVSAEDPLAAADTTVLVRETVRAVSARHRLRVSFSPKVLAEDSVGNGGHVHLSLWRDDTNLIAGGDCRFGLTAMGEAFTAGILRRLPALMAVGAPSVASYLRLVPSHWAGAFACWGLENREAALRLVTGPPAETSSAANIEVKCFDLTANPYLAAAALLAAGMAGLAETATLPEPVDTDPATLDPTERARRGIHRLPTRLQDAVAAFEPDEVLRDAFGAQLHDTLVAVRRGEIALFAGATLDEIVAATRWRH